MNCAFCSIGIETNYTYENIAQFKKFPRLIKQCQDLCLNKPSVLKSDLLLTKAYDLDGSFHILKISLVIQSLIYLYIFYIIVQSILKKLLKIKYKTIEYSDLFV